MELQTANSITFSKYFIYLDVDLRDKCVFFLLKYLLKSCYLSFSEKKICNTFRVYKYNVLQR